MNNNTRLHEIPLPLVPMNAYKKLPKHLKKIVDQEYLIERLKGTIAHRTLKIAVIPRYGETHFVMTEEFYKSLFLESSAAELLILFPQNKPSYRNTLSRKERRY